MSETSESWRARELCGARGVHAVNGVRVFCTKPQGHDGEHVAAIGPYVEDGTGWPAAVLARWSASTPLPEKT